MKRIALKIDVDTYQGTLNGVPALNRILKQNEASGTFFFSLGPDHSGQEMCSSSLGGYYNLSTRLYGRLLPGHDIGIRCKKILLETRNSGFEIGIHAWNPAQWDKNIQTAENSWVEAQMTKASARFSEIFSEMARCHAAAGWRMNRHALRLTQRMGFAYASDCRGHSPFIPVIDGEIVSCPQIPTSLPTLDEILSLEPGFSPDQAIARILQLSTDIPGDHVFTLRAELEGMRFSSAFERLLAGWKNSNVQLVALNDILTTLDVKELPRHIILPAEIPGRSGKRMAQGPVFLQD